MATLSAISSYESLDLSIGSEGVRASIEEAPDEASEDEVVLSDLVGPVPANLTPAMQRWYRASVDGYRQVALDAVRASAAAIGGSRGAQGVFFESRRDEIEDKRIQDKRKTLSAHMDRNAARYQNLARLNSDRDRARERYDDLHAQHNRNPRMVPRWYILVLLGLLVAEAFINYQTLLAVKFMTQFTALGTVIVLGAVLAWSAHLHGTLLRQARILFDPAQEDIDRLVGWRMLGLGTAGLAIVLSVVAYARGAYLADVINLDAVLGGGAPDWIGTVGGSMLGNVAVWVGGVILAFLLHDPDPHFPDALKERERTAKVALDTQEALDAPLKREFEKIDARARQELTAAINHEKSLAHSPEHQAVRRQVEQITQQDARVLAVLDHYRGKLVAAARGRSVMFVLANELDIHETERCTAGEYAATPLSLKFLKG